MMEIFSRNKMLRGSISTAEVPDNIRFFQSNASSEETEDQASDRKNGEWLRVQLVSDQIPSQALLETNLLFRDNPDPDLASVHADYL